MAGKERGGVRGAGMVEDEGGSCEMGMIVVSSRFRVEVEGGERGLDASTGADRRRSISEDVAAGSSLNRRDEVEVGDEEELEVGWSW